MQSKSDFLYSVSVRPDADEVYHFHKAVDSVVLCEVRVYATSWTTPPASLIFFSASAET